MAIAAEPISTRHTPSTASWLPLFVLPTVVLFDGADWPAWMFMWSLSIAIYAGLKWLTFADCPESSISHWRAAGYLLFWPGMNAKAFLNPTRTINRPDSRELFYAATKLLLGVMLVALGRYVMPQHPWVGGWIGIAGIAFVLHFGLFHLLSVGWRDLGIDAMPIMNAPIMASSLSDFWSRRWNLAFRDLAHAYMFRPHVGRLGVPGATMAVFVVSGVVHDFVISTSAGAGFGWPTLYFTVQGLGLLFERSRFGRRIGLGKGVIGRLYCAGIVLSPIGWLFHRPFVEQVVLPMLRAF